MTIPITAEKCPNKFPSNSGNVMPDKFYCPTVALPNYSISMEDIQNSFDKVY